MQFQVVALFLIAFAAGSRVSVHQEKGGDDAAEVLLKLGVLAEKFAERARASGKTTRLAIESATRVRSHPPMSMGHNTIDFDTFQVILTSFKIVDITNVTQAAADAKLLYAAMGKTTNDKLPDKEFVDALTPKELPPARKKLVDFLFNKITEGQEVLTEEGLKCSKNKSQFLRDIAKQGEAVGGRVTMQVFENYYRTISTLIARDDYFELMFVNAWHIMDQPYDEVNTVNRRVLVKSLVGAKDRVVAVRDDCGRAGEEGTKVEIIRGRLEEQGEQDVGEISLFY